MSSTAKKPRERRLKLSPELIDGDQQNAIDRLFEFNETMLVGGMGAGKSVIALTAIQELIKSGELKRVLIVAPKRVVTEVWAGEADAWEHLSDLRVLPLVGHSAHRLRLLKGVQRGDTANVVVINFELLTWLAKHCKLAEVFDGCLIDELSRVKSARGPVFRTLAREVPKMKWRCGMTGTPVAEDFEGLYGQIKVLDGGRTFSDSKHKWLRKHFVPIDYDEHQWAIRESHVEEVLDAVAPFVHVVPDYTHRLPPLTITPHYVELPTDAMETYRALAKNMVLDEDVTAQNAAVLTGKLQQAASGSVYTDDEAVLRIHDAKLLKMGELIMERCKNNQSVMLIYWYLYQRDVLRKYGYELNSEDAVERWNARKIRTLLAHPKSCGHGLNLQKGGYQQIWWGPIWPNDLWQQTIARLWRRGQTMPVQIDVIVAKGTIDEVILARMQDKEEWHELFLAHMAELTNGN